MKRHEKKESSHPSRTPFPPGTNQAFCQKGAHLFGRDKFPLQDIDYKKSHLLDYPKFLQKHSPLNSWARRMRLKEWHYISVTHDQFFFAFALIQLGYISQMFMYLVDFDNGETQFIDEYSKKSLFGRSLKFAPSSLRGKSLWKSPRNFFQVEGTQKEIIVNIESRLKKSPLSLNLNLRRKESLALHYPLSSHRGAYTHKEATLPTLGSFIHGKRKIILKESNALGVSDWTRSFSNRHTFWNWASFSTTLSDGRTFGINLSQHIYDDHNGHSLENAQWVDHEVFFLGAVDFIIPEKDPLKKNWSLIGQISSKTWLELEFTPQGKRQEKINLGVLRSDFIQPFGLFNGYIIHRNEKIIIKQVFGVMEKHYSKW